jgi:hypothetical protein
MSQRHAEPDDRERADEDRALEHVRLRAADVANDQAGDDGDQRQCKVLLSHWWKWEVSGIPVPSSTAMATRVPQPKRRAIARRRSRSALGAKRGH